MVSFGSFSKGFGLYPVQSAHVGFQGRPVASAAAVTPVSKEAQPSANLFEHLKEIYTGTVSERTNPFEEQTAARVRESLSAAGFRASSSGKTYMRDGLKVVIRDDVAEQFKLPRMTGRHVEISGDNEFKRAHRGQIREEIVRLPIQGGAFNYDPEIDGRPRLTLNA